MNKTTINRAVGFFRFSLLCCCPLWYYADPLDRIAVCISQQTDVKLVWWTHTSLYWWRAGGDLSLWWSQLINRLHCTQPPRWPGRQLVPPLAPLLAQKHEQQVAPVIHQVAQQEDQKGGRHIEGGQRALHSQEALGCLANAEEQREQEPAQKH